MGASFLSRGECAVRDRIGVDRILWGADYPHIEGTWPHTEAALRDAFIGCTPAEIRQMTSENAAGVYGFDLDALRPHAERVGPELSALLSAEGAPVSYSEADYALGKVSGMESARRLLAAMAGG